MWLWPRRAQSSLLTEALILSRLDAKRAGADVVLAKLRLQQAVEIAATHADQARAVSAAMSLSEQVGAAKTGYRLDRIVISETASAFNDGIVRQAKAAELETGIELEKVWRSEADACPSCALLSGSSVPLHEDFPDGEPGSIHPQCRCLTEIRRRR